MPLPPPDRRDEVVDGSGTAIVLVQDFPNRDKLMLWGDELFGYGTQQPAEGFWDR